MKKLLVFIMCLGVAFATSACGGDSSNGGNKSDGSTVSPPIINGENEMPLVPID